MTMIKGNDGFDQSLRSILDPYEVPYNSADWALLEKQLGQGKNAGRWQSTAGLIGLFLAGSLAITSTVYLMVNEPSLDGDGAQELGMVELTPFDGDLSIVGVATEKSDVLNGSTEITEPERAAVKRTQMAEGTTPARTVPKSGAIISGVDPEPTTINTGADETTIKASVTEGCPGATVEFAMTNIPADGIYLWNFGDGSFSNKPKPSHTFSKPGTFEVMLSHSSLSGGKFANKPVSDRIIIHEVPDASFQFIKREYENSIPSVHFENRSVGGKTYSWDFGDGSTSSIPHPDHVYKKQGNYTVTLTTSNAKGCFDRVERSVRIDADYNLLAATTFSPNSDGVDDTFIPDALRTLGARFHLSIFNAVSGELVYETSDPQRPWNGRNGNRGEVCSPGEFLWMVEMKDGEGLGGTYNGSISLLR